MMGGISTVTPGLATSLKGVLTMEENVTTSAPKEENQKKTNRFKHQSFGKKMGALVLVAAVIQVVFVDFLIVLTYIDTKIVDIKNGIEALFYSFMIAGVVWGAVGSSNWTDAFKTKFGTQK